MKQLIALALAALSVVPALPAVAAAPSVGKLWGLQFVSAQERQIKTGWVTRRQLDLAPVDGIVINYEKGHGYVFELGRYWDVQSTFTGDGELPHLGDARFMYEVPEGRMLVLNRVENAGRVKVNGFPLSQTGTIGRNNPVTAETLHYVFGPGESVMFAFDTATDRAPASISGMTVDPALLGGSLPAGEGDGAAK